MSNTYISHITYSLFLGKSYVSKFKPLKEQLKLAPSVPADR